MNVINPRRARLLATAALFSVLGAAQALAQASPVPGPQGDTLPTAEVSESGAVEEVVVTGTAIRGVAPVGSATVNVTRDTVLQSGVRDAGSLVAQLPQGSGLGSTLNNSNGRRAGVNLRGLGNNATLLLVDGHRMVQQGATNQISDPTTFPFAAIERVEVVTDGASAIYGSDAVAGVVNYILRKNFEGVELTAGYTRNEYDLFRAEALIGHAWSSGSVMAGLSFETNNHVQQSIRPYLMQDLRPFGGNDARFNGLSVFPGLPGAVIVNNVVYGLPDNLNGRTPTAAEVQALRNNPTLYDNAYFNEYFGSRRRESGIFRLNQDFGRAGELTFTTIFNILETRRPGGDQGLATTIPLTVTPSSPYYIQGLGTGNQTIVYNARMRQYDRELNNLGVDDTYNLILDYKVDLFSDFQLSTSATYGFKYD